MAAYAGKKAAPVTGKTLEFGQVGDGRATPSRTGTLAKVPLPLLVYSSGVTLAQGRPATLTKK